MVNAAPNFERMANVIDGASDFFYEVFGPEFGCHARSAIGVAELPHRAPVEINGEFEMHV
jgi:enamine deaminase RidA (YjgF/YER057c/UK114 family)